MIYLDVLGLSPNPHRARGLAALMETDQPIERLEDDWATNALKLRIGDTVVTGPHHRTMWEGLPSGIHIRVWPDGYSHLVRSNTLRSALLYVGFPPGRAGVWAKSPTPPKKRELRGAFQEAVEIAERAWATWHLDVRGGGSGHPGRRPSLEELRVLLQGSTIAIDTETTGLDPFTDRLVGIAVSSERGHIYIPIAHMDGPVVEGGLPGVRGALSSIPSTARVIGHNSKFDWHFLRRWGVEGLRFTDDTMVLAWLCGYKKEPGLGLKALTRLLLRREPTEIKSLGVKGGKAPVTMDMVPWMDAAEYAIGDVNNTLDLLFILQQEAQEKGVWDIYKSLDMPTLRLLGVMEERGIALDLEWLGEEDRRLDAALEDLEARAEALVGHPINLGSTPQLNTALAEMGWESPVKTPKGAPSLKASAIEGVDQPLLNILRPHRDATKLQDAFTKPYLAREQDTIHTSFNLTGTSTGRFSSSSPNLQQVPSEIKPAFIPRPNHTLIGADYSQLELRILAWISRDATMTEVFKRGEDIHDDTRRRLGYPDNQEGRRKAKVFGYGIVYGADWPKLAETGNLPPDEAQSGLRDYLAAYPGVRTYVADTKAAARRDGVAWTAWGRPRFLPDAKSYDLSLRAEAERQAVNHTIQGTAADLVKSVMLTLAMGLESLEAHLLLQVHDEVIIEVPDDRLEEAVIFVGSMMETADFDPVPLKVDIHVGKRWSELKG